MEERDLENLTLVMIWILACALLAALALWLMLRARNMHIWIGSYLRRRLPKVEGTPAKPVTRSSCMRCSVCWGYAKFSSSTKLAPLTR